MDIKEYLADIHLLSESVLPEIDVSRVKMAGESTKFFMQEGLLYTQPKYGAVYVFRKNGCSDDVCAQACLAIRDIIKKQWELYKPTKFNVVAGFDPSVWEKAMTSIKKDYKLLVGKLEGRNASEQIIKGSEKFLNDDGLACVMCRTLTKDDEDFNERVLAIENDFKNLESTYQITHDKTECGGEDVFSGLYVDGLANKPEALALQKAVSCKGGVNGYQGGTYMLQQKFLFSWNIISQKNAMDLAKMIGRSKNSTMLFNNDGGSHITRVHHIQPNPHSTSNFKIHRISMPYERKHKQQTDGGFGGANKESGIFYISFSKSQNYIKEILKSMVGDRKGVTHDSLISTTSCLGGAFYYLPASAEFEGTSIQLLKSDLLLDHWDIKPKNNQYMFYNHKEYLNRMSNRPLTSSEEIGAKIKPYDDPPSERILHLIGAVFENWEDTWFHPRKAEPLPHLKDASADPYVMEKSMIIRQANAVKLALGTCYTSHVDLNTDKQKLAKFYGVTHDLFRIHPLDILAGKMPLYGLGVGQIAIPYLKPDSEDALSAENIKAYVLKLNEVSGYGHVVPNHKKILDLGVPGFLAELDKIHAAAADDKKEYYASVRIAFEGVQDYIVNYSKLALYLATKGNETDDIDYALTPQQVDNMIEIHQRMQYLGEGDANDPSGKPRNFLEAIQLVFTLHACLHITSEPVSIGRIDVILEEYVTKEWDQYKENPQHYQEIFDAFFLKIGEKVQLSRETRLDLYTVGTIAVPYRSDGRFPRGDGCNQWVQQVTVGGYSLNENGDLTPPNQYRNAVALMCLKASKRLPLNAPCLSLRVHRGMDEDILKTAAQSILSGGAHPIFNHDDRLIPALEYAGFTREQAVDYSCDGCYEPIIPGKSEFSFCYVPLLPILEMTINRGATILEAGSAGMRGYCISQDFRPKDSNDIKSMDDLKKQFGKHLRLQMHDAISGLLSNYGNISNIYVGQLLSSMIDGCMETGKDIYQGGAEIKMIALMAIAFANTVDSLYAIQELCFGERSAISLEYLLKTLQCDWGFNCQEPWYDPTDGNATLEVNAATMKQVREHALNLPKYGLKTREDARDAKCITTNKHYGLKQIADWLSKEIVAAFKEVTEDNKWPFASEMRPKLEKEHGKFHFALGSGTFEGYVGWGLGIGASADGRRKGQPLASDMSPTPMPQDIPDFFVKIEDIYKLMPYWDIDELKTKYSNGCEIDLTISEDTNEKDLVDFLRHYANEEHNLGGNILTLTTSDQETFRNAKKNPEQYDLVRVRTGGWSEFYISFYTPHQLQHLRRTRATIGSSPVTKK